MLYFKAEKALFERIKNTYSINIQKMENKARTRRAQRGRTSDTGSPIHHRMSPEGMLHEIAKKAGRLQATQSNPAWADTKEDLKRTVGETVDIINYALFLGALCSMKLDEMEDQS